MFETKKRREANKMKKIFEIKKIKKEVIKMKKLFAVLTTMAMLASFAPIADAASSASLGLTVSFDKPLRIWCEREDVPGQPDSGPFDIVETGELRLRIIYEDLDTVNTFLLVHGLDFGNYIPDDLGPIPERQRREGTLILNPDIGDFNPLPYTFRFTAENAEGDTVDLRIDVIVLEGEMSIVLVGDAVWDISGAKFGDEIENRSQTGAPLSSVENDGTIPVMIGIDYDTHPDQPIIVGTTPGLDRLVTYIGYDGDPVYGPRETLDAGQGLELGNALNPGDKAALPITLGMPTGSSNPAVAGFSLSYRILIIAPAQ